MARAELIGHMECPECGFHDAEVRPDKSGSPYRFCPDCTAQYFTRGGVKAKNLLEKVRKITSNSPQPAPEAPAAVPAPAPEPAQKRSRVAFDLGAI